MARYITYVPMHTMYPSMTGHHLKISIPLPVIRVIFQTCKQLRSMLKRTSDVIPHILWWWNCRESAHYRDVLKSVVLFVPWYTALKLLSLLNTSQVTTAFFSVRLLDTCRSVVSRTWIETNHLFAFLVVLSLKCRPSGIWRVSAQNEIKVLRFFDSHSVNLN